MHNAPTVYVPTQPEGNGLTLPTLLSLLAHGLVIGLLVYSYYNTETMPVGSIETVMVSPEQLAEMQGQILANRAAAASAMQAQSSASSAASAAQAQISDGSVSSQNPSQPNSQRVPVFTRSDDGGRPMLMSEEQHQRLLEQNQEYEQQMAEWAAQLDESVTEEHAQIEQDRREQHIEEQKKLGDFRNKQNNPPKITRPSASDRNIEITADSAGKNFHLSDGQSTISGDTATASRSKGSSRSAAGGNLGASNSEIIGLIKRNYNPPTAAKGSTQSATLTITVNASGNIINVTASGPDSAVNEAAKQAVLETGRLPIDADDPKYPTFTVQFRGSN